MAQWTLPVDDNWIRKSIRDRLLLAIGLYLLTLIVVVFFIRSSRVFDYKTWIVVFILGAGSVAVIWARLAYWELAIRKTWDVIIVDGMFICGFGGARKVKTIKFGLDDPLTIETDITGKYWLIESSTGDKQKVKLPVAAYPTLMEFVEGISADQKETAL